MYSNPRDPVDHAEYYTLAGCVYKGILQ